MDRIIKGIFANPICTIYEKNCEYKETDEGIKSTIVDEGLYGNHLEILEETGDWCFIMTSYGYRGYVKKENILRRYEVNEYTQYRVVIRSALDILGIPIVQGESIITLFRGSIIEVKPGECTIAGWVKVRLLDGNVGFVREIDLATIKVSDDQKKEPFCVYFNKMLYENYWAYEKLWRSRLVETAMGYLGTQYRWGGKTPLGIDCSGLVFMIYWLNGVIIWRDAKIKEGYPIKKISMKDLRIGDLLFFPGHVAMYIGKSEYIHSTGNTENGGVVINSLNPNSMNFRRDLKESLYAIGGVGCKM